MKNKIQHALLIAVLGTGVALGQANAQDVDSAKQRAAAEVAVKKTVTQGGWRLEGNRFEFSSAEFLFDGKVVKGAPYSAQAVTEFTQTLGDGNRIVRNTTASIARDSEGRTRREQSFEAVGPWSSSEDAPHAVFINDPIAGVKYVLEPNSHKAKKSQSAAEGQFSVQVRALSAQPHDNFTVTYSPHNLDVKIKELKEKERESQAAQPEVRTESLGSQVIEGVQAEGHREIHIIPAGKIGNERPIEVVSETWMSPELQVVVMSRRSDPRVGETVYKLTDINRAEPAPSLFEVPSDYTVVDEQADARQRQELERKMKAMKEESK